jgi:hypothetical protein
MPALMAVISGNADPLKRELAAVQRMAQQAGASMERSMGGGSHGGQAGIMRETLVLMREIGRGNFTRIPGSLSILLQRMGILNLLMKDSAQASQVLASAWEVQSVAASTAALAATRKAQASLMAFEADVENTEATLAQAVADENGAVAAIANAQATQAKAVAAREAAAAQAGSSAAGIGAIGITGGIILGLLAGIYIGIKQIQFVKNLLGGLEVKDFHPEYIAKHLQAINRIGEEQKAINKEVQKSIDLYNSAAKAAERVGEATKSHYDHLRKMNSFEKDPAKKAARELEIDQQERQAELGNKFSEKTSLETEAAAKQRQAQAINVTSKEHDENLLRQKKSSAEEAQKVLDEQNSQGWWSKRFDRERAGNAGITPEEFDAANLDKKTEAMRRIADFKTTVDQVAANDELRKKREELTKQAGGSAAAAAAIGLSLPGLKKKNDLANKNEAEEAAAALAGERKMSHDSVNSSQQIGAYAAPAVHTEMQKHTHLLHQIANNTAKIGGGHSSSVFTKTKF